MDHGSRELWIQKDNMKPGIGWGMDLGMFCRLKSGFLDLKPIHRLEKHDSSPPRLHGSRGWFALLMMCTVFESKNETKGQKSNFKLTNLQTCISETKMAAVLHETESANDKQTPSPKRKHHPSHPDGVKLSPMSVKDRHQKSSAKLKKSPRQISTSVPN